MWFTIQVSNHSEAGLRIPTEAGAASWETIFDGRVVSAKEVRAAVDELSKWYRHARCFMGAAVGKLYYAVLR